MSFGTDRPSSTSDLIKDNLTTGAALGAVSFLIGYVLTFVMVTIDGVETGDAPSWKVAGWVFYGGHNVEMQSSLSGGGESRSETFSVFAESDVSGLTSTVPEFVYLLVPVVVLVLAGFLLYVLVGRSLDVGGAVGVGASVTLGYVVLSLLGTFLFEYSESVGSGDVQVTLSVGPELLTAIVIAGIVYPVLFGAVGALVGRSVSS